jgi:hypothetical protein
MAVWERLIAFAKTDLQSSHFMSNFSQTWTQYIDKLLRAKPAVFVVVMLCYVDFSNCPPPSPHPNHTTQLQKRHLSSSYPKRIQDMWKNMRTRFFILTIRNANYVILKVRWAKPKMASFWKWPKSKAKVTKFLLVFFALHTKLLNSLQLLKSKHHIEKFSDKGIYLVKT